MNELIIPKKEAIKKPNPLSPWEQLNAAYWATDYGLFTKMKETGNAQYYFHERSHYKLWDLILYADVWVKQVVCEHYGLGDHEALCRLLKWAYNHVVIEGGTIGKKQPMDMIPFLYVHKRVGHWLALESKKPLGMA